MSDIVWVKNRMDAGIQARKMFTGFYIKYNYLFEPEHLKGYEFKKTDGLYFIKDTPENRQEFELRNR